MNEPKTYGAVSPEQIIELFEMKAKIALMSASEQLKVSAEVEARTWREAADLLRRTEFVGWNGGSAQ